MAVVRKNMVSRILASKIAPERYRLIGTYPVFHRLRRPCPGGLLLIWHPASAIDKPAINQVDVAADGRDHMVVGISRNLWKNAVQ